MRLVDVGAISSGAAQGYVKGYPYEGPVESDVVAQWVFDEPSGNIVDEVSGITLTAQEVAAYNVTLTGTYAGISPGISGGTNTGDTPRLDKETPTASLDLAAGSNITIEAWIRGISHIPSLNFSIFEMDNAVEGAKLLSLYISTGANEAALRIIMYFKSDDNTTIYKEFTPNASLFSSDPIKLRLAVDKSSVATLYQDGTALDTVATTSLAGKAFTNVNTRIGRIWSSGRFLGFQFFSVRVSHNATNNSGGPNGG